MSSVAERDAPAAPAATPSAARPLPVALKAQWATGAFGVSVLMNGIAALGLFYFTTVLGIGPAVAGFLIFASKLLDAASDPVAGWLSDRTESRWGRRRPWLLAGAIVSPLAFVMVFTVPFVGPFDVHTSGPGLAASAYVLLALFVYTIGYSLFNVPYMAMPAEMTQGFHERSTIHGWRVIAAASGGFAVQLLAGIVLERGGKDWDAHAQVGLIGGAIIFVTMLVAFFGTARAPQLPRVVHSVPVREQVQGFLRNRPFQQILAVKLVQLLGVSASTGGLVFFLVNVLDRPLTLLPAIGGATTAAVFLGTPVLVRISKAIGKRGGYLLSAAVTGVTALSWMWATPDEPVWALMLRGFGLGIAFAGNVMFAMSMLTDAMELDRHRTGMAREGMYSALYSFVEKLSTAIGPLILGSALAVAGFDPRATGVGAESVRQAVLVGIAYVPFAAAVVACTILAFYRLDERELEALRAQRTSGPR